MAYAWDIMDDADIGGWDGGGGSYDMGSLPDAGGGSIFDGISGFFDGAWNAVGGALGTYMDFENWKFDRQMTKAKQDAALNRANAETRRMMQGGTGLGGMGGTLVTFALLGVAGLLVYTLAKK